MREEPWPCMRVLFPSESGSVLGGGGVALWEGGVHL